MVKIPRGKGYEPRHKPRYRSRYEPRYERRYKPRYERRYERRYEHRYERRYEPRYERRYEPRYERVREEKVREVSEEKKPEERKSEIVKFSEQSREEFNKFKSIVNECLDLLSQDKDRFVYKTRLALLLLRHGLLVKKYFGRENKLSLCEFILDRGDIVEIGMDGLKIYSKDVIK